MAKQRTGGTPATVALDRAGVAYRLLRYEHDPRSESFGLEAAQALGVAPDRVFKTLVASLDAGRASRPTLAVGIVPVSTSLDLKAMARALGAAKAVMADVVVAERATGYVVGGISPVGQKRGLPTVLDHTALDHEKILVSAGRRGLELEVAPADLVAITGATVAEVGRSAP